jgi:hypothetical protein
MESIQVYLQGNAMGFIECSGSALGTLRYGLVLQLIPLASARGTLRCSSRFPWPLRGTLRYGLILFAIALRLDG